MTGLSSGDVQALGQVFAQAGWSYLRLRIGDDELELSVDPAQQSTTTPGRGVPVARQAAGATPAHPSADAAAPVEPAAGAEHAPTGGPDDTPPADQPGPAEDLTARVNGHHEITAPNLGTFYAAPSPGEAPYVKVGQRVESGDEVALIEVMKLYTPVRSDVSGTVVEIVAEDGQLVEFGQPLVVVSTDDS